jgi:Mce-associated membrane protein
LAITTIEPDASPSFQEDDVDDTTSPDKASDDPFGGDTAGRGRWSASQMRPQRLALVFGIVAAMLLGSVVGWLGFQSYHARKAEDQRAEFLQVGRQGAVNLTTIDWRHADADVQRILGAATGTFYDDFSQRSQPFVDVVKKARSTSVGTVTAAGLESSSHTDAQVLVAVSVETTNAGTPQQEHRAWRMRISVTQTGDDMKVSHVEFVP